MNIKLTTKTTHSINSDMFGLFFEDINYAADGGLYAEMIENRSFEFKDCYGDRGDYYVQHDPGFAWTPTKDKGTGNMLYVEGSPLCRENPHYLRFTATKSGQGFTNRAYNGIYMKENEKYTVSFYARCAHFKEGNIHVIIKANGKEIIDEKVRTNHAPTGEWQKWTRYEVELEANKDIDGGEFIIKLDNPGTVEFDFISMMPQNAVAGIFRKDLFDALADLHPGFLRFPGGCIVEGNTLENRYRWKETIGEPLKRKWNFNRWALHGTNEKNKWHTNFAHYNQSYGIGFYEYFLLCELISAKPLPVLNVGLACQYQSFELVDIASPEFDEFIQDALDLIEFANGSIATKWGAIRAQMGHPESFNLEMIGIGNEQWETEKVDFFERYKLFEQAIHKYYPDIKLIGSAGPTVGTDTHKAAWEYYLAASANNENFTYAVDEHYYMKPDWFTSNTDFYDNYDRTVKVFAGEYAAHPADRTIKKHKNTMAGALAEAAFLTGVERNSDVVVLSCYAPLFARIGFEQWSPDMIWFDEKNTYLSPSYYVQKLFSEQTGTIELDLDGQEKDFRKKNLYISASLDETTGEYILKLVNTGNKKISFSLKSDVEKERLANATLITLTEAGKLNSKYPQASQLTSETIDLNDKWKILANTFCVIKF